MLEVGIDLAKVHFRRIFQQIQNFIDMNQIVASGPFLQVFLEEVILEFFLQIKINFPNKLLRGRKIILTFRKFLHQNDLHVSLYNHI